MEQPSTSILVTVYNREPYLAACLESILLSNWRDFEVVVVDDASSDRSVEIAEEFVRRDARVRLHRNSGNLGDYRNRNRAAELARGRYLKYLDADDLIYPHSLRVYVEAMERFPEAVLGLSLNLIDPDLPYPFATAPAEAIRAQFLGRSLLGVGPSASIIRRDAFEAVGGFSGRQFIGDSELWLKLASRWPVVSLPPALVWWRRHEGQQMNLEMARPEILVERFRLDIGVLESTPHLAEEEKREAAARLRQHHARRLLALATKGERPREAMRLARESGLRVRELLAGLGAYR